MTAAPSDLIDLMARAYYERSRSDAVSLPTWENALDHWRAACRRDMGAALEAAEAAGYRVVKP